MKNFIKLICSFASGERVWNAPNQISLLCEMRCMKWVFIMCDADKNATHILFLYKYYANDEYYAHIWLSCIWMLNSFELRFLIQSVFYRSTLSASFATNSILYFNPKASGMASEQMKYEFSYGYMIKQSLAHVSEWR